MPCTGKCERYVKALTAECTTESSFALRTNRFAGITNETLTAKLNLINLSVINIWPFSSFSAVKAFNSFYYDELFEIFYCSRDYLFVGTADK